MGRNKSTNFALLPQTSHQRSTFDMSHSHKFTFNVGELIPFYWQEILPGTTVEIATSKLVRMQTPLYPIMDNMYLDTYYFFVPNRLIWDNWKAFQGENDVSKWIPEQDYYVPQAFFPSLYWDDESVESAEARYAVGEDFSVNEACLAAVGSVADYLGIPAAEHTVDESGNGHDPIYASAPNVVRNGLKSDPNSFPFGVSALPFRAYAQVINDWFRDQNLEDPQLFEHGDSHVYIDYCSSRFTDTEVGYWSSCTYPELESAGLGGMVYTVNKFHDYFTSTLPSPQKGQAVSVPVSVDPYSFASEPKISLGTGSQETKYYITRDSITGALMTSTDVEDAYMMLGVVGTNEGDSNAFIDINSIRLAFAMQSQLELDARGGTRYTEIIRSNFNVVSPDARLQRSEYLGGNHVPINVSQVVSQTDNTSGASDYGRLGQTGAFSVTGDKHGDFIQSFTEHGILLGVCVVRYDHSYQNGIARPWMRFQRFDYYMPAFANIGEQPVKTAEIWIDGDTTRAGDTFGFQEAWSEYRFMPNRVSGEMRSNTPYSLDVWHLADNYAEQPYLSSAWLKEDKTILDRCLAVTSDVANQFFADFFIDNKTTAPIPMYSIPATLGHF